MRWDFGTIDYLYKHYPMQDARTICKDMQITPKELMDEAAKLQIFSKGELTCEEKKIVRDYGDSIHSAIVFLMDNRTVAEVASFLP